MLYKYNTIRGATLIHGITRALSRIQTYPRQVTPACSVAEYSVHNTFDCALSGPFAKQFLTRFSAPRALCIVLIGVISASTVYFSKFYHKQTNLSSIFITDFNLFENYLRILLFFFGFRIIGNFSGNSNRSLLVILIKRIIAEHLAHLCKRNFICRFTQNLQS